MYFKNNPLGRSLAQDKKPTPFPRTTTSASFSTASAPTVNTLNGNCHEIVNEDYNFYQSAAMLNSAEVNGFSDEDVDDLENVDFSTDPHQRLIL